MVLDMPKSYYANMEKMMLEKNTGYLSGGRKFAPRFGSAYYYELVATCMSHVVLDRRWVKFF